MPTPGVPSPSGLTAPVAASATATKNQAVSTAAMPIL